MATASQNSENQLSRRAFGKQVSLGTLLAITAETNCSRAEEPLKESQQGEGHQGNLLLVPKEEENSDLPPIEDAIMAVILQRYPHAKLTAEVQQEIYRGVLSDLGRSEALSQFPLKNHQEPAFIFRAYRQDQP